MNGNLASEDIVQGEVHHILAYIESTNVRIYYLERLLGPSTAEEFAKIKLGLNKAIQRLENLQEGPRSTLFAVKRVTDVVGKAFTRLQRLEEMLKEPTESKEMPCEDGIKVKLDGAKDSHSILHSRTRKVQVPVISPRPKYEVVANLLDEEKHLSEPLMVEPDRIRQGSTCGWICTHEIICGIEDNRCIRPKLAFMKVYEVKALKGWLAENKYLQRSGGISRLEKLLHLLFALQDGVRLEVIAVLFSRSPRQISDCMEVFEGLMEMHSETMLPAVVDRPLYDHLWKIVGRYATVGLAARSQQYYPWEAEDLYKVVQQLPLMSAEPRAYFRKPSRCHGEGFVRTKQLETEMCRAGGATDAPRLPSKARLCVRVEVRRRTLLGVGIHVVARSRHHPGVLMGSMSTGGSVSRQGLFVLSCLPHAVAAVPAYGCRGSICIVAPAVEAGGKAAGKEALPANRLKASRTGVAQQDSS
ncbi:hypothetical protein CC78DRAFT_591421 [Lojkania enalia]|uniref:Uncharacterized protein n=1 Tax=Lojkania enalia TaxID=147567 RepID=A0A9P4N5S9_9PLEO|nr:hypothetical protein CC78DRAFT_591421 [Didymosphaeria enalia]